MSIFENQVTTFVCRERIRRKKKKTQTSRLIFRYPLTHTNTLGECGFSDTNVSIIPPYGQGIQHHPLINIQGGERDNSKFHFVKFPPGDDRGSGHKLFDSRNTLHDDSSLYDRNWTLDISHKDNHTWLTQKKKTVTHSYSIRTDNYKCFIIINISRVLFLNI